MAFKFVVLSCLLACANAGLIAAPAASSYSSVSHGHQAYQAAPLAHYAAPVAQYAAPLAYHAAPILKKTYIAEEQYAPAQYDFAYAVHDSHTGDIKEQKESRNGDAVHGMYSLVEADGSKRIVEYTADDHSGFNAVVHREPSSHPVAVKAYAAPIVKTIAAAPAYNTYAAPAYRTYAAPAYKTIAAAPVAHYSAAPAVSYATLSAPTHVIHH